ncbi:hypothetical protein IL306_004897, partial [Fusarium sp. DS 682]
IMPDEDFSWLSDAIDVAVLMARENRVPSTGIIADLLRDILGHFEFTMDRNHLEQGINLGIAALPHMQDTEPNRRSILTDLCKLYGLRYELLGDMNDLDNALSYSRMALSPLPQSPIPDYSVHHDIALLWEKYIAVGGVNILDLYIQSCNAVLDQADPGDPELSHYMSMRAIGFEARFDLAGDLDALQKAIFDCEASLEITSKDDPERLERLQNLCSCLGHKFEKSGTLAELDKIIQVCEEADSLSASHQSFQTDWIEAALGRWLKERYWFTCQPRDLDRALEISEKALLLAPDAPGPLANLGTLLRLRFRRLGDMTDIDRCIELTERACSIIKPEDPFTASLSNLLATAYASRFHAKGDITDSEKSVMESRKAIEVMSPDNPRRFNIQMELADHLGNVFENSLHQPSHPSSMEILEEAITLSSDVLDKKPFSNHDWPLWLAIHGNLLILRFRAQGSIDDVQDAVRITTEAVSADGLSHSAMPYVLTANAHCLRMRFEISARIEDIDRAIDLANKALEVTQEKASAMPDGLLMLSICLSNRSVITGTLADLHHAIEAAKSAVQLTPTGSIHWAVRMKQLSQCYAFRYRHTRSVSDLNEAIRTITMAIDETPDYRPEKPRLVSVKATHLYHRSLIGSSISRRDQDEAFALFQHALELLPQGSVDRVQTLVRFGSALMGRFFENRAIADGDRSIETFRQSLCEMDSNDPSFTGILNSLGMSLVMRFAIQENPFLKDLEDAVSYFTQCFRNRYGDGQHIERIQGAMGAADILCYLRRPQEATELLQDAIASLPLVTSQSLPQLDQQILLKGVSGLATSAAATALEANASAAEALMLLERGRGIIAGLLMGPQPADMEMLDVETAAAFMQARERLQTLSAGGRSVLDFLDMDESLARSSHILRSKALREAEEELLAIVERIQENPKTNGFLKPPSESEVLRVLNDDTIVVVNEDNLRCDALILSQSVGTRLVPLKKLHSFDVRTRLDGLTSSRPYIEPTLLEWLWDAIAQPVLNELGFCEPPSDGHPPRIFWIMTGSLHPFPIHAAGLHINGSRNTVIDRVMSSYASSLRSFVSGRSKDVKPLEVSQTKQALLVSMRQTPFRPDLPDLPLAVEEIDKLETLTSKLGLETNRLDCPDRATLLNHLESCTFFHFAGHGESDPLDPSCSGLMLRDSLLTVNDLQGGLQGQSNLVQYDAFLSYLSACLTGANDAVGLEDENIHTIGAFQLSGFRHVIGAQLQVFDATCSLVAESVYKNLTSNPLTDLAVCASLHFAVKQARDVWLSSLSGATETRESPSETSEERKTKSLDKLTWIVDNQSFKMLINRNGRLNLQRKQPLKHIKAEWVSYVHYGP